MEETNAYNSSKYAQRLPVTKATLPTQPDKSPMSARSCTKNSPQSLARRKLPLRSRHHRTASTSHYTVKSRHCRHQPPTPTPTPIIMPIPMPTLRPNNPRPRTQNVMLGTTTQKHDHNTPTYLNRFKSLGDLIRGPAAYACMTATATDHCRMPQPITLPRTAYLNKMKT